MREKKSTDDFQRYKHNVSNSKKIFAIETKEEPKDAAPEEKATAETKADDKPAEETPAESTEVKDQPTEAKDQPREDTIQV